MKLSSSVVVQKGWFGDQERRRLVEYFKVLVNGGLGSDELISRAVALLVALLAALVKLA